MAYLENLEKQLDVGNRHADSLLYSPLFRGSSAIYERSYGSPATHQVNRQYIAVRITSSKSLA
jgi:hypothetical protein